MEEVITEKRNRVSLHIEEQAGGEYQISCTQKSESDGDGLCTATKPKFYRAKDRTEMYGLVLHLTGGT